MYHCSEKMRPKFRLKGIKRIRVIGNLFQVEGAWKVKDLCPIIAILVGLEEAWYQKL